MQLPSYWLKNVTLEKSFTYNEYGTIIGTETEIIHLLVLEGKIERIVPASGGEELECSIQEGQLSVIDAGGLLALPSFRESHCHLDKSLLGNRWGANKPVKSILERFALEKVLLADSAIATVERAITLLDLFVSSGNTFLRSHVDVDPQLGLSRMEAVQEALELFPVKVGYELVAFPQQGLLRSQAKQIMKAALRQGATLVGGVDPANVDNDIEGSLATMMELAVEADAGIDLHLHDPGQLGLFTIKRLAAMTVDAGFQGRVAVSHAYCLGEVSLPEAEGIAELLAESGISLITSVPVNAALIPVELLRSKGVHIAVGCDNIYDAWSPFGNGDIVERVSLLTERLGSSDEFKLSRALGYITDGVTPLDDQGIRTWPTLGVEANMVFIAASCSAEVIARRKPRLAVIYKGEVVAGQLG